MAKWNYAAGHRFRGTEVDVVVEKLVPENTQKGWVPAYICDVVLAGQTSSIGELSLRIGYTDLLVKYGGHIGYRINPDSRGQGYAAKACQLICPIFQSHGMDVVWITCNPDNWASRKTAERLGCQLVDIVDLPEWVDMYQEGERQKCRYRLIV